MKTITLNEIDKILDRWEIVAMHRSGVGVKLLEFNAAELKFKVTHIIYKKGDPTVKMFYNLRQHYQKTYINHCPVMSTKKYNEIEV